MSKKKKKLPFHITHNYKKFKLEDGTTFWAKDKEAAEDYERFLSEQNIKNN
jgi:hypothetical protein|tara:strand:+ start:61 stop:213 length:153 start_codon:yes stop_codon:yes gene_type:complete